MVCQMIGMPALAIGDCLVGVVRISSLKDVPHLLKISVCNTQNPPPDFLGYDGQSLSH